MMLTWITLGAVALGLVSYLAYQKFGKKKDAPKPVSGSGSRVGGGTWTQVPPIVTHGVSPKIGSKAGPTAHLAVAVPPVIWPLDRSQLGVYDVASILQHLGQQPSFYEANLAAAQHPVVAVVLNGYRIAYPKTFGVHPGDENFGLGQNNEVLATTPRIRAVNDDWVALAESVMPHLDRVP